MLEDSVQVLMPKIGQEFACLSQMDQPSWQDEIRYSENPPQFRTILHEERSTKLFFKESRTDLNYQTDKRTTQKTETMSGVTLGTLYIASRS